MQPAGQDPKALRAPGTSHSTALFAAECQSFLDNVIAGLGQIRVWNDARGVPRTEGDAVRAARRRAGGQADREPRRSGRCFSGAPNYDVLAAKLTKNSTSEQVGLAARQLSHIVKGINPAFIPLTTRYFEIGGVKGP